MLTEVMGVVVGVLVVLYVVIPLLVRLFPRIMLEAVFLHHVKWRPFVSLSRPDKFGLKFTRSFRLETEGAQVGVWHILPKDLQKQDNINDEHFTDLLASGHPVILYLHGTAGNRGVKHRVQLYKVLARSNAHVVTIDYRGYGDSLGLPSEEGMCHDAFAAYKWILNQRRNSPVYLWGHSMGTGVATKVSKWICDKGLPLDGLVLEAPFNNLEEAARCHPLSFLFRSVPWCSSAILHAIRRNKLFFASDNSIKDVNIPILIVNAKDDKSIPYSLGVKLFNVARDSRNSRKDEEVQMIIFEASRRLGHDHIYKAPELPDIIRNFMEGNTVTSGNS